MKPYIIQGGMIGFLLVFGLNTFNGNDLGVSLMRACIAAAAFGLMARWFARTMFSELHLSLYLAQQAAAEAEEKAAQAAEAERETADTAAAE
jgi:uncharacterized phage protein gp47/JayE